MNTVSEKVKGIYKRHSEVIVIYSLLVFFIIISAILVKDFFTIRNFKNIFTTSIPFLIAAYAQTIAIIAGGVDLSAGASISLTTTICATTMVAGPMGVLPGLVLALLAGLAIGILNGVLITKFNIQALIGTLSVSIIVAGLALAILDMPGGSVPREFVRFVDHSLLGIVVLTTAGLWLIMNRTWLGKNIYAVGGNEGAAYSAGVNVAKTKIVAFAIVGLLVSIAGIILACQMGSGDPTAGSPLTIKTLTAAVIGGASFSGGKGRIICTIAGVMIFSIINNILNLLGVSTFYQYVAQGVLLIFAIAIASKRN